MRFKIPTQKIEFKKDGVYFLPDYNKLNEKELITKIIEICNVTDANFLRIEDQFLKREKKIFLSNQIHNFIKDEEIKILVSEDKLIAKAKFYPALFGGKTLEKKDIIEALFKENITYGIDFGEIDSFFENRDYEIDYIVAKGTLPEKTQDGYIHFFIDINKKKPLPKILENGSLDYKNLNLFESVKKNQVLAEKREGVIGKYGIDVYGEQIVPLEPLPPPDLPMGKNTFISEDGKYLISKTEGRVLYYNKQIRILPILELPNGINNSTGNVKFNGHIIITGVILSGFTVEAEGNIEIRGSIESANVISSSGSVFVTRGIHSNANVYAQKDVNAQFIENANVYAQENIIANYIMQGEVKCGGDLKLIGDKARFVSGKAIVGKDAFIKYVGSSMCNNVDISLGINPKLLEKYEFLYQNINEKYEKYNELEKVIKVLSKKDMKELSKEKQILFEDTIKEKIKIKKELSNLKKQISIIIPLFTKRIGKLHITSNIYAGTKIVINNAILFIKNDLEKCLITNEDGQVVILKE